MKENPTLFLVDGSGFIFRAYHALPALTRGSDGLPIGAVSGFCTMLWKLLWQARSTKLGAQATHFAVIFDHSSQTFRKKIYPAYKENRAKPPEDILVQFALIRQATRAFNVACIEQEGFEADDLIASYAFEAEKRGMRTIIVSSDKDLMQLVNSHVTLYDSMKDKTITTAEVIEKWGVGPEKMVDLQSLMGDSSDNIPGVAGIGPKTAAKLLEEYGDLDTILAHAPQIKQEKRRAALLEFREQAPLVRRLVTLRKDVPLPLPLEALSLDVHNGANLMAFLKALELKTLLRRVATQDGVDPALIEPASLEISWEKPKELGEKDPAASWSNPKEGGSVQAAQAEQPEATLQGAKGKNALSQEGQNFPERCAQEQKESLSQIPLCSSAQRLSFSDPCLALWLEKMNDRACLALFPHFSNEMVLKGISLAAQGQESLYIALEENDAEAALSQTALAPFEGTRLPQSWLRTLLESDTVLKIGHGLKPFWSFLKQNYGITLRAYEDMQLASYVLGSGLRPHDLESMTQFWLGQTLAPYPEGEGRRAKKKADATAQQSTEKEQSVALAFCQRAEALLRLWSIFQPLLIAQKGIEVYETLEKPLIPVLSAMEQAGICVDKEKLQHLSTDFAHKQQRLEKEIYQQAGTEFNIGSPKQLGDILFGKLQFLSGAKTKTGQFSTSAQILEELAAQNHKFPQDVLSWRHITKLKNTYVDALPHYMDPQNRVHTCYALASTTTGRLSSLEPNLQNIPIRTEEGRQIREAFIAPAGYQLLSADYSQIELRLLAHFADEAVLKKAFTNNQDVHRRTAAEIFGVAQESVTPELRRRAKAVNFGIIYGISPFGLAQQLSISREEAAQIIRRYLARFPALVTYMESMKAFARQHGFVQTLFGRRIHYPEILAKNAQRRAFSERAAINAPLQGSAADILRRAMIKVFAAIKKHHLPVRLLLQVHDELVFEVPTAQKDAVSSMIKKEMEGAAFPAVSLSVPLVVDIGAAQNWGEAH